MTLAFIAPRHRTRRPRTRRAHHLWMTGPRSEAFVRMATTAVRDHRIPRRALRAPTTTSLARPAFQTARTARREPFAQGAPTPSRRGSQRKAITPTRAAPQVPNMRPPQDTSQRPAQATRAHACRERTIHHLSRLHVWYAQPVSTASITRRSPRLRALRGSTAPRALTSRSGAQHPLIRVSSTSRTLRAAQCVLAVSTATSMA